MMRPTTPIVAAGGVVILAGVAPWIADTLAVLPSSSSWLFTATQALFLLALATNWGTIAATLGRLDLGHGVFVGVGAYAAGGTLIAWGLPPLLAVVVAGVAAAGLAVLVATTMLRLAPHLFAVMSFAVLILIREVVRLAEPVTRGAQGLALPPELTPLTLYRSTLIVVAGTVALAWWWRTGPRRHTVGSDSPVAPYHPDATRHSEGSVRRIGIYTSLAASTGLVGALWAIQRLFIDPNNAFQALRSLDMAIAAIVGGLGSVLGPLVGASALFTAREMAPVSVVPWLPVLEIAILAIVVIARPDGLIRGSDPIGERLFGEVAGRSAPRRPVWSDDGVPGSATPQVPVDRGRGHVD